MIYYVSNSGSDKNSGTKEAPFQTIQTAVNIVRENDEIYLFSGRYYLENEITLSKKKNLTIKTEKENPAEIVGGKVCKDWVLYKDDIYTCKVPKIVNELYVNGKRANCAKYPKIDYAKSAARVEEDILKAFLFDKENFPVLKSADALKIHLWPSGPMGEYNWHSVDMPISIDYERSQITLFEDTWYQLGVGTRYYIYNSLELLTETGEYYLDRTNLTLYYKAGATKIEDVEIIIPMVENVITLEGCENILLENIKIAYSDMIEMVKDEIFDQAEGIVFIENSRNIVIDNCEICYSGLNAISMHRYVQNVTVQNCHIHHIGHTGVRAYGDWISTEYMNKGHSVLNNHIHHLGERVGQCAGVQLMQTGDSLIMNNLIHDSVRYAISLLAPSHHNYISQHFFNNEKTAPHMLRKYTYVRNNTVAYNDVYRCCTDSQDTGLLHSYCGGENNVFYSNSVHDSEVPFSFATGIYLDDDCARFTVEDNIIYNLNHHGDGCLNSSLFVKGVFHRIKNNRVAFCNVAKNNGVLLTGGFHKDDIDIFFEENIFYKNSGNTINSTNWNQERYANVNNNIYCNDKNEYLFTGYEGNSGAISLSNWRSLGYDKNSVIENPMFVEEETYDFRLMYHSVGLKKGFNEIDIKKIGLTAEYTLEDADDVTTIFPYLRDEKSYGNLKKGDKIKLNCLYRSKNGMVITKKIEPEYLLLGDSIVINEDGEIEAINSGMTKILVQVGTVKGSYYVFVDDEVVDIEITSLPEIVTVGERYDLRIIGVTKYGQYVKPKEFLVESNRSRINLKQWQPSRCAIEKLQVTAQFDEIEINKEFTVDVKSDSILSISINAPSSAFVGEEIICNIIAKLTSGKMVNVENFSIVTVLGDDIEKSDHGVTILSEGEKKITFSYEGKDETVYIRGVKKFALSKEWEVKDYGASTGLVTQDGICSIYSNGANIWYNSDECTFMYQKTIADSLSVEMIVYSVEHIHDDSQVGILMKAENHEDSRCVNLRVTPEGSVMLAARLKDKEGMKAYAGALSEWKKGGNTEATNMEGAAGKSNSFPVYLKLTYDNGKAIGYIKNEKGWQKLGEIEIEMPREVYVGAAMFSVDTSHCAMAEFYIEM